MTMWNDRPLTKEHQRAFDKTLAGADENRVRAVTRLKQEFRKALEPLLRRVLRLR